MKRAKTLGSIIVLYCVLQAFVGALLYNRLSQESSVHANLLVTQNVRIYQGILDAFRPLPARLFSTYINYKDFNLLVQKANSANEEEKDIIRKTLFKTLRPIYETILKPEGFRELQLHLQSGERFIQLFDPAVYGKDGLPIANFKLLNDPLTFAEGYSFNSGDYLYFFPLFYEGSRIGTIEMGISFERFNKLAQKAINAKKIDLLASTITPSELRTKIPQASAKVQEIISHLKNSNQGGFILKDHSILTIFPLFDARGEISGYVSATIDDLIFKNIYSRFTQDLFMSALILVLTLVLGFVYYRYIVLANNFKEHNKDTKIQTDFLTKHNNFMRTLFQTIPLPTFIKDTDGNFIKCNQAFSTLFQKPIEELIGKNAEAIATKELAKDIQEADAYVLKTQQPFSYEYQFPIAGKMHDFVIHKNILKNDGKVIGVVGIMQEITQRKEYQSRLEDALAKNKEQQKQLAKDNEIINRYTIFVKLDKKGYIKDASQALVNLSGYSKEELIGEHWSKFLKEPKQIIKNVYSKLLKQGSWEGILCFERKDGNSYWLRSNVLTQAKDNEISSDFIVFSTDASNEIHIQGLSYIDELTQIYNRKKFKKSLQTNLIFAKRYPNEKNSLIFFDIDDFKLVNDTYGHLVGDSVLKEITALIKNQLREVDTFARWGGEEFAIIAPKTAMDGALKITEKLRRTISEHNFENVGQITCSFGVTEIKPTDTLESLVDRADKALYSSKNKGKNRIEFLA